MFPIIFLWLQVAFYPSTTLVSYFFQNLSFWMHSARLFGPLLPFSTKSFVLHQSLGLPSSFFLLFLFKLLRQTHLQQWSSHQDISSPPPSLEYSSYFIFLPNIAPNFDKFLNVSQFSFSGLVSFQCFVKPVWSRWNIMLSCFLFLFSIHSSNLIFLHISLLWIHFLWIHCSFAILKLLDVSSLPIPDAL